jgi:hypothetical protein
VTPSQVLKRNPHGVGVEQCGLRVWASGSKGRPARYFLLGPRGQTAAIKTFESYRRRGYKYAGIDMQCAKSDDLNLARCAWNDCTYSPLLSLKGLRGRRGRR